MPHDDILRVAAMLLAVFASGLAKGGFSGVGAVAVPVLSWVMPPLQAVAILLPVLIVQDAVSLVIYRRDWDRPSLVRIMPGITLGVFLGFLYARAVSERAVLGMVGVVAIASGARWFLYGPPRADARVSGLASGTILGAMTGFASQVAHAGSPPFQAWILRRGLGRDRLAGTTAFAFATLNWIKVPAYLALDQLDLASFHTSLLLLPAAVIAAILGARVIHRIDQGSYQRVLYAIMLVLGLNCLRSALS